MFEINIKVDSNLYNYLIKQENINADNINISVHEILHEIINYVYDKDKRYTNIIIGLRKCFIENYYL